MVGTLYGVSFRASTFACRSLSPRGRQASLTIRWGVLVGAESSRRLTWRYRQGKVTGRPDTDLGGSGGDTKIGGGGGGAGLGGGRGGGHLTGGGP